MKSSSSKWPRYIVQLGFLAFMTYVGYMHQKLGGGPSGAPPVDALCPLGGAESLFTYLKSGYWLRRTAPSSLILLISVIVMTLAVGRIFCSWICPLGTIGEICGKLGRKMGLAPYDLPDKIDRPLRYAKYIVLAIAVFGAWTYGTLFWRGYDPWVAWMHLTAGIEEMLENPWSYLVLAVFVIGLSFLIERFWCRYLCPLGALLSIFQKFSFLKVRRKESTCIECHRCSMACTMGLFPEKEKIIKSSDCIGCGECIEACPVEDTLEMGTSRRRITPLIAGFIGLVIFASFYGGAKYLQLWQTNLIALPATSNPADSIYGWMSLKQMAAKTGLSTEKLLEIGDLPQDIPLDVSVKKIEGIDDHILTEKIKVWFSDNDREQDRETDVKRSNNPDEIRGSMTLEEVAELFGLTPERILKGTTWPSISTDLPLKEIAKDLDKEVQEIRDSVKKLLP